MTRRIKWALTMAVVSAAMVAAGFVFAQVDHPNPMPTHSRAICVPDFTTSPVTCQWYVLPLARPLIILTPNPTGEVPARGGIVDGPDPFPLPWRGGEPVPITDDSGGFPFPAVRP